MRPKSLSSLLVVCVFGSVACQGASPSQGSPETVTTTAADPADDAINRAIQDRAELTGAVEKDSSKVTWSTHSGAVTLRGVVPSLLAKGRLHELCAGIPGVSSVSDGELMAPQANPSAENDVEIQRSIQGRLSARGANEVQVSASGGKVTLVGSVPTGVEKIELEKIAARTPNVIALDDQVHERPLSRP
jgi:osmotically-inducible protein OsmY